jgi:uncharacterized membrane protein
MSDQRIQTKAEYPMKWSNANKNSKAGSLMVSVLLSSTAAGAAAAAVAAPVKTMTKLISPPSGLVFESFLSSTTDGSKVIAQLASSGSGESHFYLYSDGIYSDIQNTIASQLGDYANPISLVMSGDGNTFSFAYKNTGNVKETAIYRSGSLIKVSPAGYSGVVLSSLSADGLSAVGVATNYSLLYNVATGGVTVLGNADASSLNPTASGPTVVQTISPNGAYATGYTSATTNNISRSYGVEWTSLSAASNATVLLPASGYTSGSQANAVSNNKTVVGVSFEGNASVATAWNDGDSIGVSLGTLSGGGNSAASAIDAAGDVAVGYAYTTSANTVKHAVAFDLGANFKLVDLGVLSGDSSSEAESISGDGKTIYGWSSNSITQTPFIYLLSGTMQNYTNLLSSFANSASVSTASLSSISNAMLDASAQNCATISGQNCIYYSAIGYSSADANGIKDQYASLGNLTYGHQVNSHWTIGGTLVASSSLGKSNYAKAASGFGAVLWGTYQTETKDGNLSVSVAASHSNTSETVTRGLGYTDVQQVSGNTSIQSTTLSARLSYAVAVRSGWLLTPSVGFSHATGYQAAYAETLGDYKASYTSAYYHRDTVTLGLSGQRRLNATTSLNLTGGFNVDTSYRGASMSLTTNVPSYTTINSDSSLRNRYTRPFLAATMSKTLRNGARVDVGVSAAEAAYSNAANVGLHVGYSYNF